MLRSKRKYFGQIFLEMVSVGVVELYVLMEGSVVIH